MIADDTLFCDACGAVMDAECQAAAWRDGHAAYCPACAAVLCSPARTPDRRGCRDGLLDLFCPRCDGQGCRES